jgi:hypothetical protein
MRHGDGGRLVRSLVGDRVLKQTPALHTFHVRFEVPETIPHTVLFVDLS